jgi:hypothetical protein
MTVNKNKEIVLQNKLLIRHDLIEDGLKLIERETIIGKNKRCDILFRDKYSNDLYVEVKEQVDVSAIAQIDNYRTLVNDNNSRFMIISNYPIKGDLKSELNSLGIEYRTINKKDVDVTLYEVLEIPKGNSKFSTKDNIIKNLDKQGSIANEIYLYIADHLHKPDNPIICNISDGIMFQLVNRNEKFLSISTVGKRLLFHIPNYNRDEIFNKYKNMVPEIYRYKDNHLNTKDKEPNQIDIKLKDVPNLEYIRALIDEVYKLS